MFRLVLPVLFTGCGITEEIDKLQDDIGKLTNDFVVSSFYVGAEEFEYAGVNIADVEGLQDVQSVVYLATADVSGETDPLPLSRAEVSVTTLDVNGVAYTEPDPGFYYNNADGGLLYTPNETITIDATHEAMPHSISVMAPPSAEFDAPEEHPNNIDMVIDISGQGFDSALVGVAIFPAAEMVYSNEPTTFQELYDLAHPEEAGSAETVVIPGETFAEDGIYLISVGGVYSANTVDMTDINTAFSSLLAAQMAFDVVCVPQCITMPE
jgi:hypothetical protein